MSASKKSRFSPTALLSTARRGVHTSAFRATAWHLAAAALVTAVTASACTATTTDFSDDDDGSSGTEQPGPTINYVGAEGVFVNQVAMYQGVKRVLAQDGLQVGSNVPLVAGRDALVRVFYTTTPDRAGQIVKGRLFLWTDGVRNEEPIETDVVLAAGSTDNDLNTTANFNIPGELVGATFAYSVELAVEAAEGATDNAAAKHPAEAWEEHAVEGPQNTFRVVLAPYQYNADGSGRLPDISEQMVESYRTRFLQLYPVSDVEVTVREPVQWSSSIQPNGQGWQEVGISLSGLRGQDGMSADVYYYGIFNPSSSFPQFCQQGCLLGVTLLNNQPVDAGNPGLRLALGVGFNEVATDTAAHELGHAHGREHANCGPGLDPSSIDAQYPHPGGYIGTWGYDIVGGTLIDPGFATDIMGYCDNQWISDYNFAALLSRGRNVNLPKLHPGQQIEALDPQTESSDSGEYTIAAYDGSGNITWKTQRMAHPVGEPIEVAAMAEGGATRLQGHFYRYDHLPGGWFVYPKAQIEIDSIELAVDGELVRLAR